MGETFKKGQVLKFDYYFFGIDSLPISYCALRGNYRKSVSGINSEASLVSQSYGDLKIY